MKRNMFGSPTWNMTGRRFVARSRTRTAWCLPGDPSLESRESIVGGREESGSREGKLDIVNLFLSFTLSLCEAA